MPGMVAGKAEQKRVKDPLFIDGQQEGSALQMQDFVPSFSEQDLASEIIDQPVVARAARHEPPGLLRDTHDLSPQLPKPLGFISRRFEGSYFFQKVLRLPGTQTQEQVRLPHGRNLLLQQQLYPLGTRGIARCDR